MKLKAIILTVSIMSISSCAIMPFPHFSKLTPKVDGKILNNGVPVRNTEIRIATGNDSNPCAGKHKGSITNYDGIYSLDSIKEFNPIIVVMAHKIYNWNICIKENDEWRKIGSGSDYALADNGPYYDYEINCDLAKVAEAICEIKEKIDGNNAT